MAIFKLANQHYDHIDVGGSSPVLRYFIRTPTFVFPTNCLIETVKLAFLPATNNCTITVTVYHDNFRFSKTFTRTFVINDTVFETEFGLQITAKDCLLDFAITFATHTGQIPSQDVLLSKQNNAGYFEPLFVELVLEKGEQV